jgi:hypothetical protein
MEVRGPDRLLHRRKMLFARARREKGLPVPGDSPRDIHDLPRGFSRAKDHFRKTLPDVPLMIELGRNDTEKAIFRFASSDSAMGFPTLAPPGVPAERVIALRRAFAAALSDPALLADAEKRGLPIRHVAGADVQQIVDQLIATPGDVVSALRRTVAEGKLETRN